MAENGKTAKVINTGENGMWKDSLLSFQVSGTMRDVRNAVIESDEANSFGYAAESATELCARLPEGMEARGYYFVEERDWHVVLLSGNGGSEIGYIDGKRCEYVKIYSDSDGCELGFGTKEFINIESKVMQPCNDLNLYWSVGNMYYKLNLDDITTVEHCEDLKLFPGHNAPQMQIRKSEKGGYNMVAGAKQYAYKLEDVDGNDTNFVQLSNPVYIGSENNRPGDFSEESVTITIDNLPKHYDKVTLAVVETTGGQVTSKIIASEYYSDGSVEITHRNGDQKIKDIPISAITIKQNEYILGRDLFQYDGRLFLYNVKGEVNLDYQDSAAEIDVRYKTFRVPIDQAKDFRGLRRNENYQFVIWFNLIDERRTLGFPLINTDGESGGQGPECNGCRSSLNGSVSESGDVSDPGARRDFRRDDVVYEPDTATDQEFFEDPDGREDALQFTDMSGVSDLESATGEDPDGANCECDAWDWALDGVDLSTYNSNEDYAKLVHAAEAYRASCECSQPSGAIGYNEEGDALMPMEALANPETSFTVEGSDQSYLVKIDNRNTLQKYQDTSTDPFFSGGTPAQSSPAAPQSQVSSGSSGSISIEDDSGDFCSIPQIEAGLCTCTIEQILSGDVQQEECFLIAGGGGASARCSGGGIINHSTTFREKAGEFDITTGGQAPRDKMKGVTISFERDIKPKDQYAGSQGGNESASGETTSLSQPCEPTIIYENGECCKIKEVIPCQDGGGRFGLFESCEVYPTTKKCPRESDDLLFGEWAGKPIRMFRTPSAAIEPHFVSYHEGVPTSQNLDNYEGNNMFARIIWPEFTNIRIPTTEELGGVPLNKKKPFTIGIIKRDKSNRSNIASGILLDTYEADIYGNTHLVPKSGVNAPDYVDRFIEGDDGKHVGRKSEEPGYTFHSPDTHFDRPYIDVDRIDYLMDLEGKGKKHGIYAEGRKPDSLFKARRHQKGARQAINLNHYELQDPNTTVCIKKAAYAKYDSVVSKDDDYEYPLLNKGRESSVYIETVTPVGQDIEDTSFSREVNQFEEFLGGRAKYVDVIRNIPDQYGGLDNASFVPLYEGSEEDIQESGTASLLARDGDSFINLFSIKRTSYVSNKVQPDENGYLARPLLFGGGINDIPVLGKLFSKIIETISGPECGTVPNEGDIADPRANNDLNGSGTEDCYFPQVQTTLVSFPVESDVNLGYRGSGDSKDTSTYRDLNGQKLDSSFYGEEGHYENAWLDRYHAEMTENARWRLIARIIINFLFTYGIGMMIIFRGVMMLVNTLARALVGLGGITIGTPFAIFAAIMVILIGQVWMVWWINSNLDNKFVDKFLEIDDCYPDKKIDDDNQRMDDNRVRGLEDNYYEYNYDYSLSNKLDIVRGIPSNYRTCKCLEEPTLLIMYSSKQNPGSWIDAYRNFKVNNFTEIRANSGPITNMFEFQNQVYVHTTDQIYNMRSSERKLDIGPEGAYLGYGNVLNNPIAMFSGPSEGSYGLLDPNAAVLTKYGYFFIDREARDVYVFNGSSAPTSMGKKGMRNFFNNYLYFKYLEENPSFSDVDEKTTNGLSYALGFDPRHERLLITKIDKEEKDSFTLSYFLGGGEDKQKWIGFHDYKPKIYTWDRQYMYSIAEGGLWKHYSRDKFLTFYGKKYDMSIDLVMKHQESFDSFEWLDTLIDTEAYSFDKETGQYIRNHKVTFDKVALWNSYQNSGVHEFLNGQTMEIRERVNERLNSTKLDFLHRRWRFNEVWDHLIDFEKPMLTADNGTRPEIIQENISSSLQNGKFYDNYLVNRLIFSKFDDIRLIFKMAQATVELKGE